MRVLNQTMFKGFIKRANGKKALLICALIFLAYTGSYCCLRLSKQLVHQEVSLIEKADMRIDGRAVCYTIHHDIGRGSFVDENNFNAIRSPSTAVQISKCLYYPLVRLEVAYWKSKSPRYILETICSD